MCVVIIYPLALMNKQLKGVRTGTKHKEAHTDNTKYGMGDFYGTGVRAKIGTMRDSYSPGYTPVSKKSMGTPPKTFA